MATLEELTQRIEQLEKNSGGQRIYQEDVTPGAIKQRHISEGVVFVRSGLVANLPTTGETSQNGQPLYWATDTNTLYLWNGTAWKTTNFLLGSDARGDIFYRNSTGGISRLAPGTSGQFLKTLGTGADPAWATVASVSYDSCRVYSSSAAIQSLTSGTPAALAFNAEDFDTNTMHDTVTNNSRITIKTTGKYVVTGIARFAGATTGYRSGAIYVNGAIKAESRHLNGSGSSPETTEVVTTILSLTATDYVELYADQATGGALNAIGGSVDKSSLSVVGAF